MYHLYIRCMHKHCDHLVALLLARFPYHETTLVMLHYGTTSKQDEGFIVLECDGAVSEAVCTFLDLERTVIDYAPYAVPFSTLDPPTTEERELSHLYGPLHTDAACERREGGRSW